MHCISNGFIAPCVLPRLARLNEVATPLTKGEAGVIFKNCLHIATRVDLYAESHGYTWWISITNYFSIRQYIPSYSGGPVLLPGTSATGSLGSIAGGVRSPQFEVVDCQ